MDERERFEKWVLSNTSDWQEVRDAIVAKKVAKDGSVLYASGLTEYGWQVWQAAAAIRRGEEE